MSTSLIIVGVVLLAILILVIASKVMNVLVGLITTVGGILAYLWLGTTDSWAVQLRIALEFKITPDELRTYSLIAIGVGVVVLLIGVFRGRKTQKIVVVKEQVPSTPVESTTNSEIKKEEKVEPKLEEVKEETRIEVEVDDVEKLKNETIKEVKKEENDQVKKQTKTTTKPRTKKTTSSKTASAKTTKSTKTTKNKEEKETK